MKKLFYVRHAKSSWVDLTQPDVVRPLNDRGLRDAPSMANRLVQMQVPKPDLMVSSNAKRAMTTCQFFAHAMAYPQDNIIENSAIYGAGVGEIVKIIQSFTDENEVVYMFGHNPTITYFAQMCKNLDIDNVPTCGIIEIEINIEKWSDFEFDKTNVTNFYYPKQV